MGEGRGQRQNADVRIYGHISTKTQIFHLIWHNFDHLLDDWKVYWCLVIPNMQKHEMARINQCKIGSKDSWKTNNLKKCGRPGGVSVISDTCGQGGEGESKMAENLRTSFMYDPLVISYCMTFIPEYIPVLRLLDMMSPYSWLNEEGEYPVTRHRALKQ